MSRKRPRQWWDDEAYSLDATEPRSMIIEEEARDDFTGLLDANGRPIMRQRQPFGFRAR